MGCPQTPLSCLTPENIFAGVYNPNCGGFADPSNFQAEQVIFDSGFEELINNFGVEISYYVNTFNLSAMNHLYGEHTTQQYLGPTTIKAYVELEEQSPVYTLAGFDSADSLTLYLHINTFTQKFSALSAYQYQPVEPKAQDKIKIDPLGCFRPGSRSAKIFDITEVLDQNTTEGLNPAMGHYVWRIKAVRNEYNFETNEPRESVNNQPGDNTFFGKLSSSLYPELTGNDKQYPMNSDEYIQDKVFPPSTSGNSGSVYGDYY